MKFLVILVMLVIFFAPTTTFAQQIVNQFIIEPVPDSTNIAVTVEGELLSEEVLVLTVRGTFDSISDEYFESFGQITKDNPTMVFELDYPFLTNEVYTVTALYDSDGNRIKWIPIFSTGETSTNTNEELPLVLGQKQSTSVEVSWRDAGLFVSLRDENKLLSQEIEKKDAIIMEQLKVIQDLAEKISSVKFTKSADLISLAVAQTEPIRSQETFEGYLQSLSEENKLLSQEIEKKDAIIMEQLKVIQDLAEKISKVTFESTSSNFSLV